MGELKSEYRSIIKAKVRNLLPGNGVMGSKRQHGYTYITRSAQVK